MRRAAVLVALLTLALADPAAATFPGTNGQIAFVRQDPSTYASAPEQLRTVNPDGTGGHVVKALSLAGGASYAPNGNAFIWNFYGAFCGNVEWLPADGGSGVTLNPSDDCEAVGSFSPDGQRVAYKQYRSENAIVGSYGVMDVDGSNPHTLWSPCILLSGPVWTVGNRIAVVAYDCATDTNGIWIMDPDGSNRSELFTSGTQNTPSDFVRGLTGMDPSPDGKKLLLTVTVDDGEDKCLDGSTLPNPADLYTLDIATGTLARLTFTPTFIEQTATYSPDGTTIALTGYDGACGKHEYTAVHTMAATGGTTTQITFPPVGHYDLYTYDEGVSWQPRGPATTSCVSTGAECEDGLDNDDDGFADVALPGQDNYKANGFDPGCGTAADPDEHGPATMECDNGGDDDGDGFVDWRAQGWHTAGDPECTGLDDDDETLGDKDRDGVLDDVDTCPTVWNNDKTAGLPPQQGDDDDHDGIGDACDPYECPRDKATGAAVPYVSSGIVGCDLKPGDVMLWRSNDPSWAETELGDSFFSHAAIVIGYIDLDRKTASPSPDMCDDGPAFKGDRDPGCELVYADAMPHDPTGEIALRDISLQLWGRDTELPPGNVIAVGRYGTAVGQNAAAALLAHLLGPGGAGRPENQTRVTWDASDFDYNLAFTGDLFNNFYCSSLVKWGYEHGAGFAFHNDHEAGLVDKGYFTPDDLILSQYSLGWVLAPPPGTMLGATGDPNPFDRSEASGGMHVMVVDEQGRREGKDLAGTLYDEIPGAWFKDNFVGESVTAPGAGPGWKYVISAETAGYYHALARTMGPQPAGGSFEKHADAGTVLEFGLDDVETFHSQPVAQDDHATLTRPDVLSQAVTGNDRIPVDAEPISLSIESGPAHGKATLDLRSIKYEADAGFTGSDHLTYRVCSVKHACDEAELAIDVLPERPVLEGESTRVAAGAAIDVDVLANDTAEAGLVPSTLKITGYNGPGSASIADGKLHYVAPASEEPLYLSVGYEVCDTLARCGSSGVFIQVDPPSHNQPNTGNVGPSTPLPVPLTPGPTPGPGGVPGPSTGGSDGVTPSVTVRARRRGTRLTLSGSVVAATRVTLQRRVHGRWRPLGGAVAKRGAWRLVLKHARPGWVIRVRAQTGGRWVVVRAR